MRRTNLSRGFGFALVGGSFTLVGAGLLAWQLQIARWPATTGTLLAAEVTDVYTPPQAGKPGQTSFHPTVRYTYTVAGQTYEGSDYTVIPSSGPQTSAQAAVNQLWKQQHTQGHIAVYYQPNHPSRSDLEVLVSPWR